MTRQVVAFTLLTTTLKNYCFPLFDMKQSKNRWHAIKTVKSILVLMLMTTLFTACKHERYLIVLFNNSEQRIENVTLWLGDQSFDYGDLNIDAKRTGIFEQNRLTPTMKLVWTDQNNNPFEQTFQTFDSIPNNYDNGRVHLKLQNNNQFILSYDDTKF
jgi:hypothetical protein